MNVIQNMAQAIFENKKPLNPLRLRGLRKWSRLTDSNRRPTDYKSVALPTELRRRSVLEMVKFPADVRSIQIIWNLASFVRDFLNQELIMRSQRGSKKR